MSVKDPAYWLWNPIEPDEIRVLRAMQSCTHVWASMRLQEASLIASGCVVADLEAKTYEVTAKGQDALAFYSD